MRQGRISKQWSAYYCSICKEDYTTDCGILTSYKLSNILPAKLNPYVQ